MIINKNNNQQRKYVPLYTLKKIGVMIIFLSFLFVHFFFFVFFVIIIIIYLQKKFQRFKKERCGREKETNDNRHQVGSVPKLHCDTSPDW